MQLQNELQQVIKDYEQSGFPAYSSLTPIQLRKRFNDAFKSKPKPETIKMEKIETRDIEGPEGNIKLRLYYPTKAKKLPALMYFHGGGFVIRDDMDTYDYTCRLMASRIGCIIIAVDYHLAPEHPFPAAPEDCYAAICWVAKNSKQLNINAHRFGVWGESCGGNLATVITMMARDRNGPKLACQIIVSPMLDIDFNRDSYKQYATGYILTQDTMRWFWGHYLVHERDKENEYALPVHAKNLNDLPPALIVTTEYDILKDDGEYYSQLLQRANTKVIYCCYPNLIHGFFDLYNKLRAAKMACDDIMEQTKLLLHV